MDNQIKPEHSSSEVPAATSSVQTTSGSGALKRLLEKQAEEIEAISQKIDLYTKYKGDYEKLKELIGKMQEKVRHPHRIPIAGTDLAFIDGHIIHTNEFHVLLGDNYFALRSGAQAAKIIDRRLAGVQEQLKLSEDAKKKTEDWMKATEEHQRDKEEFVEIIETM